ncbi:MAG: hypothetical protein ACE5OY_05120 [Candidatus Bathyarchaeia archaeon]
MSSEESWPKKEEELSDHSLMIRIYDAHEGRPLSLDEIRDLLPTRSSRRFLLFKKTIRPEREYVQERLRRLGERGFLFVRGEDGYEPIEKEEYFKRVLADLLEREGYRVLEVHHEKCSDE